VEIGYKTIKALAFQDVEVSVACRDLDRAKSAIDVLKLEEVWRKLCLKSWCLKRIKFFKSGKLLARSGYLLDE